jgi:F-type H+-transporting ATPase subunit delta
VRDRRVSLRYARSLLDVAVDRDLVDEVEESLRGVVEIVRSHSELRLFLKNPQVPRSQKKQLLGNVFTGRLEPLVLQFLQLVVDKDRINHLSAIQGAFTTLVEQHKGLQRARVVTAVPLPEDLQQRLVQKLTGMMGRQIILEKKVDPSIIGGVSVTMGDWVLDGTLSTGLKRLRETLERAPLGAS